MVSTTQNVVIVGGGIAGMSTAYYLGESGVSSLVIEPDSIGSHASGFAYGGLSHLGGGDPVFPLAEAGIRLHRELSRRLPDETGVKIEYRPRESLGLVFTEDEARAAKAGLHWRQSQQGPNVRWLEAEEVETLEPRISDEVLGAVHARGNSDVEPYQLMLALAHGAERVGATILHGRATGLKRSGGRVTAVVTDSGEVRCDTVVLAMGPWTGQMSDPLGVPIKVRPLKGQILRLRAPGAPFEYSIGWAGNYATTKPDGMLWAGTTEEDAGFDESPTSEARDRIMGSLLKMVPSLADAQLVRQTACLTPLSADGLPVLGAVPGWEGVYVATGGERIGILLGPAMGRVTADLIAKGSSDIPIEPFSPGRFSA